LDLECFSIKLNLSSTFKKLYHCLLGPKLVSLKTGLTEGKISRENSRENSPTFTILLKIIF
jgi:hypothetical protein